MFRTEWLEAKACAYSVGGKGEYDEVHKKYAYKLYQWGEAIGVNWDTAKLAVNGGRH